MNIETFLMAFQSVKIGVVYRRIFKLYAKRMVGGMVPQLSLVRRSFSFNV